MSRRQLLIACAVALAACDGNEAAPAAAAASPFRPVANVQELMLTVVEPAAEHYWDAVGWIIDASGTLEIRPRSEEEWEAVRNAAVMVAESGNLLMMDGRGAADDQTWDALSLAMVGVGERAIEAAIQRDPEAVFRVGGDLYEACTACHSAFALGTLRPNFGDE